MIFLNSLKAPDIIFFVLILVAIAACVGIYFLIPVINKKQYQEQRENLYKREEAFNRGRKQHEPEKVVVEEAPKTEE